MDMARRRLLSAVGAAAALAILALNATAAVTVRAEGRACAQLQELKRAFPTASAVGFTRRAAVSPAALREPIWPGTCGRRRWLTSYSRDSGHVEVTLTPYDTHKRALVALAEPAYGSTEHLADGALVRKSSGQVGVDGVMKLSTGVASVYRNVFISSLSIADTPISVAAQLRLHRATHARVLALQ